MAAYIAGIQAPDVPNTGGHTAAFAQQARRGQASVCSLVRVAGCVGGGKCERGRVAGAPVTRQQFLPLKGGRNNDGLVCAATATRCVDYLRGGIVWHE